VSTDPALPSDAREPLPLGARPGAVPVSADPALPSDAREPRRGAVPVSTDRDLPREALQPREPQPAPPEDLFAFEEDSPLDCGPETALMW
jgi:hypothetical protein